jgi:hypothetical protein
MDRTSIDRLRDKTGYEFPASEVNIFDCVLSTRYELDRVIAEYDGHPERALLVGFVRSGGRTLRTTVGG